MNSINKADLAKLINDAKVAYKQTKVVFGDVGVLAKQAFNVTVEKTDKYLVTPVKGFYYKHLPDVKKILVRNVHRADVNLHPKYEQMQNFKTTDSIISSISRNSCWEMKLDVSKPNFSLNEKEKLDLSKMIDLLKELRDDMNLYARLDKEKEVTFFENRCAILKGVLNQVGYLKDKTIKRMSMDDLGVIKDARHKYNQIILGSGENFNPDLLIVDSMIFSEKETLKVLDKCLDEGRKLGGLGKALIKAGDETIIRDRFFPKLTAGSLTQEDLNGIKEMISGFKHMKNDEIKRMINASRLSNEQKEFLLGGLK